MNTLTQEDLMELERLLKLTITAHSNNETNDDCRRYERLLYRSAPALIAAARERCAEIAALEENIDRVRCAWEAIDVARAARAALATMNPGHAPVKEKS